MPARPSCAPDTEGTDTATDADLQAPPRQLSCAARAGRLALAAAALVVALLALPIRRSGAPSSAQQASQGIVRLDQGYFHFDPAKSRQAQGIDSLAGAGERVAKLARATPTSCSNWKDVVEDTLDTVGAVETNTFDECKQACINHDSCAGFSWQTAECGIDGAVEPVVQGPCYLYTRGCTYVDSLCFETHVVVSIPECPSSAVRDSPCMCSEDHTCQAGEYCTDGACLQAERETEEEPETDTGPPSAKSCSYTLCADEKALMDLTSASLCSKKNKTVTASMDSTCEIGCAATSRSLSCREVDGTEVFISDGAVVSLGTCVCPTLS